MEGPMHPIEHERPKDYFWFDAGRAPLDPFGKPVPEVVEGARESHPTLDYRANLEDATAFGGRKSLNVHLPFGRFASFDIASFPTEKWEDLVDDAENPIPLRILVHGGRVAGQWLPDPGIVPPPPGNVRAAPT